MQIHEKSYENLLMTQIDDICGEFQNMLVVLYINSDVIPKRNNCFGVLEVYYGIRGGFFYKSDYDEIITICGRVYSLYNHTELPFSLEGVGIDQEIIDIICSGKRNDEVAIACKNTLTTLGKAMRDDNKTYMIMEMFDAIDKIYPCIFKIEDKWKCIASFVMD